MLSVKVLGPGCANCKRLAQMAERAISGLSVEAQIEKVTDYADIMRYNVLATPGLVINEQLVAAGRIPAQTEIITWLTDAMTAAA